MPARAQSGAALRGSFAANQRAEKMEVTGDSGFCVLGARDRALSHGGESATAGSHAETQDLSFRPGAWRDKQPRLVLRLTHNEIAH